MPARLARPLPALAATLACLLLAVPPSRADLVLTGKVKQLEKNVSGAIVKIYDVDSLDTREFMAQTTTDQYGRFFFRVDKEVWDWCCHSQVYPDIQFEVWKSGYLYLKTRELLPDFKGPVQGYGPLQIPIDHAILGKVLWAGTDEPVAGAVVRAWEVPSAWEVWGSSRRLWGVAPLRKDGSFSIDYPPMKRWTIQLEYIVDGFLWYTAPPRYSGSSWGFEGGVRLQRIAASGAVYWQETCSPAAGVRVLAYDQDASDGPASGADDFMGGSTTGVLGTFSISLNPLKDCGKAKWDTGLFGSAATNPDIYAQFVFPPGGKTLGRTSPRRDVVVPASSSLALPLGNTWLWRGDVAEGATATEKALRLPAIPWVEVEEYKGCSPRQIRVTLRINFQRSGTMDEATWARLRSLAKDGISRNWSRVGPRSVVLHNMQQYQVLVTVLESSAGLPFRLEHVTDAECKQNDNATSILFFGQDPVAYYNEGCARAQHGARWQRPADAAFGEMAAHEFGHRVLRHAAPPNAPILSFGAFQLTQGQSWSWSHKGTSTLTQEALASSPTYPATGEWDIMLFYKGTPPQGAFGRSFASEDDVRRLVGLAKVKRARGGACACPLEQQQN